jgi:hypothetical protein
MQFQSEVVLHPWERMHKKERVATTMFTATYYHNTHKTQSPVQLHSRTSSSVGALTLRRASSLWPGKTHMTYARVPETPHAMRWRGLLSPKLSWTLDV